MRQEPERPLALAVALLAMASPCLAQAETATPSEYSARIAVIARSVPFDAIDAEGRPVDEVPAGALTVIEDGVPRRVLEVRRLASDRSLVAGATPATGPAPQASPPIAWDHVLVALDPQTLGRREWHEATEQLALVAEALAAIGPVDVVALTSPARFAATRARDPETIRRALAELAADVAPVDAFCRGRTRLLREALEASGPFDGQLGGAARTAAIAHAATELAMDEDALLRRSLGALHGALSSVPRPTVVVWVAGGDPLPGEFVSQLLPDSLWAEVAPAIGGGGRMSPLWSRLGELWESWAHDGVRVVGWSPVRADQPDVGVAELHRSLVDLRPLRLAFDPLALAEAASSTTGGALVRSGRSLPEALASVRGRFVVTYETDSDRPGWRRLRLEAAPRGWTLRHPARILVPERAPTSRLEAIEPIALDVELTASRRPGAEATRDGVELTVVVDLTPLRARLGLESPAQLALRISATPPKGDPLARVVEVPISRLPEAGSLRYRADLVVPAGTSSYVVEVREAAAAAFGVAGPVEALSGEWLSAPAGPNDGEVPRFSAAVDARISQVRFLMPDASVPSLADIRVSWKRKVQHALRVAGGSQSSLELGIAIDVSESAAPERDAFARAASAATSRLLAEGDRVFRVDFGAIPRYLGSARGGPGALFAAQPAAGPEKTALFDALRYALDRFAGDGDRAALIVLTDGIETSGRADWREVERVARVRAIPIVVVLTHERESRARPPLVLPDQPSINPLTNPGPRVESDLEVDARFGEHASLTSRFALTRIAKTSGGLVIDLDAAERAEDAWTEVEKALAREWVVVFEPSALDLDPRQVEVRAATGRVLRPAR